MGRVEAILKHPWFHYHLMILPGLLIILLMNIAPMFGIVIAFKDFNPGLGMFGSPWVGWDNFTLIFQNEYSYRIIENTLIIAIAKMVVGLIIPIIFAVILNEVRLQIFKRTVQTIVYLPHFLSWVIIAGILREMLAIDGIFNRILGTEIMFLGSNELFRTILVTSDVWKEFGFAAIIYLAALTNINPTLYEAADMDGASRMQKIRHVTLPGIVPTIILLATLSLQNILNAGFDQVFNLYNPIVYETGDIIDTYVYRMGFEQLQYEIGTAIGLFKSAISMLLIIASYYLASKYANYRIF